MTPIPHDPQYARTAGTPLYGKRTERLETSESTLTKELAQEKAKAAGFDSLGEWLHSLVMREIHGITVTRVYLGRNNPNCGNSRGSK